MNAIETLFANNRAWSEEIRAKDAYYFERLAKIQAPEFLWIGCSDSRVPANQIIGLKPGEVFVHRNIANVVVHTDLNCLSVIQFAVDILRVKHILVVGHYGCGGVRAAMNNLRVGLTDNWLRHVQDVQERHKDILHASKELDTKTNMLCELNAIEQVLNVSQTTVLREAWERGQNVSIHGWCYGLKDGLIRDLGVSISCRDEVARVYASALAKVIQRL
jgi:carbonic anhydrase